MAEPPVLALDQRRDIGERGQRHEYRHYKSGRMKLGQGAGLKRLQLVFVDQVIADQPVLRAVAKIDVAPEQDREFILHPPEFARHGQASHDRVAELSRRARANPKLAMILAVEHRVLGHGWATFSRLPGVTCGPSNARLDGSADKSP